MRLLLGSCKDPGMAKPPQELLKLGGFEVGISNPDKIYFPDAGITKLEVARYYLSVSAGALRGVAGRPMVLKRYVDGAAG
jgi:bifunctional non-homologous end joining protein LigD